MSLLKGSRVLLTGSSGFLGLHLLEALVAEDAHVFTTDRSGAVPRLAADHLIGDLRNPNFSRELVANSKPTHLLHLAGTRGGRSVTFRDMLETNVLGTAHLLGAVAAGAPSCRVLVVSSSAVYGRENVGAINECGQVSPLTDYATSKAMQELVVTQHRLAFGMNATVARPFNLIGPGMPRGLVLADAADQIVAAEHGGPRSVVLGYLGARRDFIDARDVARALVLVSALATAARVVNIASGQSVKVQTCVELLISASNVPLEVSSSSESAALLEVPEQIGDATLLRSLTGWAPTITTEKSTTDLLNWARLHTDHTESP